MFVDHRRDLVLSPTVVESNWKSIDHTTFGVSASLIGVVEAPARFRILRTCTLTLEALHLLLVDHPAGGTQIRPRSPELFCWSALAQSRNRFRRSASGSSGVFRKRFPLGRSRLPDDFASETL